ncbi:hypothetical protein [Flectobacillus major]|uniref:hypothetical protein n=1 Tax=Flectobacillus major TaxID=103 RepID=UPI000401FE13|nr:hypothetical protein [Flectobacillus major]
MNTIAQQESLTDDFFSKHGKLMCIELLELDQLKINEWILSQINYRNSLEKIQYEEIFDPKRQKHLEMLNQQIEMWLTYCQSVQHTIKILEVDVLNKMKFDIDHWEEYRRLITYCSYLESIIRTINKSKSI